MPTIRLLDETERDHVWRLTAGHPLGLEHLDLLLARGERYRDLAGRLAAAIQLRIGHPVPGTDRTELPESTAQTIAWPAAASMAACSMRDPPVPAPMASVPTCSPPSASWA